MSRLVLLVELKIVDGQMDAFLARAREHRGNVLKNEPGCHGFEILASTERDNTVYLFELYADQAAIDLHMQTPYLQAYLEDTGPMIAERSRQLCRLASA